MNKFSFDTIKDFDTHIGLSIPNYSHIIELVEKMSTYFIKDNTHVYDLGCSTGLLLSKLVNNEAYKKTLFVGYETSENLKPSSPMTFEWRNKDITHPDVCFVNACLITSIFTLQFIDVNKRQEIINKIYKGLGMKSAFIFCEKIYLSDAYIQDIFTFSYYDYKKKSFTEEEILLKQKDLRKIMQPLTERENIAMLQNAGFKIIEPFFNSLMFKGWLCVK